MDKPLKILIVEDEAVLLMQLEALLEDEGHKVVATAMSSREAIELTEQTQPDLIFVDVHLLDGPTGVDIARHFRDSSNMTVVFMTANAKRIPEDYVGAAGVISKPFSQNGMTAAIRYLWQCIRRPPPELARPQEFVLAPAFDDYLQRLH